jgi:hypothetical protein
MGRIKDMPDREEVEELLTDYFCHYVFNTLPEEITKTIPWDEMIGCLSYEIHEYIKEGIESGCDEKNIYPEERASLIV